MRVAESHVIAGGKDVGKSKDGERSVRRARHDSKRRFKNSDAGTLGSNQSARHVKTVLGEQLVEREA